MAKRMFIMIASLLSVTFFSTQAISADLTKACALADPANTATFCSTFTASAQCHCTQAGLPAGLCNNVTSLYNRLLATFGTLQRICSYQGDVDWQTCVDQWNCYFNGGTTSKGALCSGTGSRC